MSFLYFHTHKPYLFPKNFIFNILPFCSSSSGASPVLGTLDDLCTMVVVWTVVFVMDGTCFCLAGDNIPGGRGGVQALGGSAYICSRFRCDSDAGSETWMCL